MKEIYVIGECFLFESNHTRVINIEEKIKDEIRFFEKKYGKRPTRINVTEKAALTSTVTSRFNSKSFLGEYFGIPIYAVGDKIEAKYYHPRGKYY